MDVYFCDVCGARVTSLDLRAGKGMRRRHDVICPGCVEQGKAADWLARTGAGTATEPVPALKAPISEPPPAPPAPVKPDPIAIARDRARTLKDLPQPPAAAPPMRAPETDAIPSKPAPPKPAAEKPAEGFAAAAGSFSALATGALPPPPPGLVDDPVEEDDDPVPAATPSRAAAADSPFDFDAGDAPAANPHKVETRAMSSSEPGPAPKTPRPASSRVAAQSKTPRPASDRLNAQPSKSSGKGTTSSKRASQKTTARTTAAGKPNNRLLIGSLISLVVVGSIFGLLIFREVTKEKAKGTTEKVDVLSEFKDVLDGTRRNVEDALRADELGKLEKVKADYVKLNEAYAMFEKKAKALGWNEDNLEAQLENMHYSDTRALIRRVNDRIMVLKSQQGH